MWDFCLNSTKEADKFLSNSFGRSSSPTTIMWMIIKIVIKHLLYNWNQTFSLKKYINLYITFKIYNPRVKKV